MELAMTRDEVKRVAREALSEHAGMAAGFMVERAMPELKSDVPDAHEKMAFIHSIESRLPQGADKKAISHTLMAAILIDHR